MRELIAVLGATSRVVTPSSTLEAGVFLPSEALYVIASTTVNVPTDFNTNPQTPSAEFTDGIVSFEVTGASTFKVLLAGRSSEDPTWQSDRGYCFAMVRPDIGVDCQGQPFAPSPARLRG